ncbi:hypothetical protein [Streptomyces cinereoruber]
MRLARDEEISDRRRKAREDDGPDVYDISGLYGEWETHLDAVAGRAVTPPEDLIALLGQVRERLDGLWLEDDQARGYAAMLRACGELEAIVAETGIEAAHALVREQDGSTALIAEAWA